MKRILLATPLLLTGCGETITVNTPPPPASYMVCKALPDAPNLEPLTPITASDGTLVYRKAQVDARDGQIARYIVDVRGAWFSCANQLERIRDYYEAAN